MPEERPAVSITVLNRYVRSVLEGDARLQDIRLRGEVSNFVHHRSGHCYFSLKDENCSVKAVMFRFDAQRLRFAPENGMRVVADCHVSLFERDGSFQVYVHSMFPDGAGAVRLAFERLKARLEQEGLFDAARKKPLPPLPAVVGVVTSADGAALQDIRTVLERRFPLTELLLAPVNVQGAAAAQEIAAAIHTLDNSGLADVIIVTRGGGSTEDLWVFNDERIARAAAACRTPLVSAVGHEIDFTILDYAADVRAPTPSAAAEMVAPALPALRADLAAMGQKAQQLLEKKLADCQEACRRLCAAPALTAPRRGLDARREKLQTMTAALQKAAENAQRARQERLVHCIQLADTLDPYAVLARGYAVLRHDGQAVSDAAKQLRVGDTLTAETAGALLTCAVQAIEPKADKKRRKKAADKREKGKNTDEKGCAQL